tara:strand:+ start:193 stop:450 length:258 start_codon:yes stop_codon:yes gene_type:complete
MTTNLLSNFESWKIEIDNPFPSAKQSWDRQEETIRDLESKIVLLVDTMKREKKILEDLKNFTEDNLKIISDLEIVNLKLKDQVNG